jgi:drug/metabolite transporter (DMT)-like permease
MFGQSRTSGLATALLLAVEPPATALIALAFGERLARRVIAGALLVTAGAVLVGLRPGESSTATVLGALAVAGAATAWALDNNISARVAHLDPVLVAAVKGALGGTATLTLAALLPSASLAAAWTTASLVTILAVGFAGYGVGLALVIRALRELGAARTGALFATAPLFGAMVSIMMGESPTLTLAIAAALLAAGVAAIVSEKREPAGQRARDAREGS